MNIARIPCVRFLVLCVLLTLPGSAAIADTDGERFVVVAGDTLRLDEPVVVVGSRVPAVLPGLVRDVALVDADDLGNRPARSLAEVLGAASEIEVRQRQTMGVQSDLSIRGSTFEQVQVLLDGIDLRDPQTGHHAMNLPLGLGDVARIEVLPGHGSALYGANAFGGVVNVVTRAPAESAGGEAMITGGGFGTFGGRVAFETGEHDLPGGAWRARLSAETLASDGDRPGTDLDSRTALLRARGRTKMGEVDVLVGGARREFGARDFYVPADSWERTETLVSIVRVRGALSDRVDLEPILSFRRHTDRFVLRRDDPDYYTNDHVSRRVGADLRARVDAGYGLNAAFGLETAREDIDSEGVRGGVRGPALGDHERRRISGAWELVGAHERLRWSTGVRLDGWRDMRRVVSRSAAVSWDMAPSATLRASAGDVHRLPTFTELYYDGPYNVGSADLRPETGWSWDTGLEVRGGPWTVVWSLFTRYEKDLIDWVRGAGAGAETRWETRNIAEGTTRGWSQTATLATPEGHRLAVRYAALDRSTDLPPGLMGKYLSLAPRHRASVEMSLALPAGLRLTPLLRAWVRPDGARDAVADLRLSWNRNPWRISLQGTNIADRDYEEIPGVLLPGRQLSMSCQLMY